MIFPFSRETVTTCKKLQKREGGKERERIKREREKKRERETEKERKKERKT